MFQHQKHIQVPYFLPYVEHVPHPTACQVPYFLPYFVVPYYGTWEAGVGGRHPFELGFRSDSGTLQQNSFAFDKHACAHPQVSAGDA